MKTRHFLFAAILLLCGISLTAQEKTTYPFVERDSTLYLDVYRPTVQRADKAAVITVFGGGFIIGTRDDKLQQTTAELLVERGFTVISIDYRLGLKDQAMVEKYQGLTKLDKLFQYCIDIATEDCAEAVAWVCAHAEELDIDPSKLVLEGCSAGAITVLQLDYCRSNGLKQAAALPEGWKPAAVVPYSGGVMCRKSELKYATEPAPTMLMHGTKDKIVAYNSFGIPFHSKLFGANKVSKAMDRQGIPHWIIRFEGIGHEVATWLPGSVDLFCGFVDQAISGRVTHLDATMTDSKLQPTEWTDMGVLKMYKQSSK
ncbi:MAG: alpha/beta hydrolase [Bacteroidales bacterium]|nr:alpha/beta hydrolase [Bacteroidales bacterium]